MAKDAFVPVTPGEMLKEEFLVEHGLLKSEQLTSGEINLLINHSEGPASS
jgi:plasmid maintenance system antidote protein VapI